MSNSGQLNFKGLFFQKTFYLFFGKALPVIILLLITIIYSRRLGYKEYGIFQSVWMYANIVNVIISFGISSVILSTDLAFLYSFIKKRQKTIVLFYVVLSIFTLIVLFLFSKNFDFLTKILLIAFIIIQNIITVTETLLIKQGGEKRAFFISFFYSLSFFTWHLHVLFSGYSIIYLLTGVSIISIIKLFAIVLLTVKRKNYEPLTDDKKFLKHWLYLGINEILGIISRWIDKIFLLYLLTSADFAVFFNGSFEIPLFGLLVSVTGSLLLIEVSGNTQLTGRVTQLFKENFTMLSAVVFPLFFFLFFFREQIFGVVFKNKYNESIPVFAISIFILPARINNYSVILQCFSKGKTIMWGSLLDISIAIILMAALYPQMGTEGIALAIVIATYCQVAFYLWHSAITLRMSITHLVPLKKLMLKFINLLITYLLLSLLLRNSPTNMKLIVAALVTFGLITTGMWSYIKSFFLNNYGKGI